MTPTAALLAALLLSSGAPAGAAPATPQQTPAKPAAQKKPPAPPPPTDEQCLKLPAITAPHPFAAGEELEFDVDAMGANAGKLFMRVKPPQNGLIPVQIDTQTNTMFAKVRRVSGGGTSYLNPKDLHPVRYVEETVENEIAKRAEVTFRPRDRMADVSWSIGGRTGKNTFRTAKDAVDLVGAIYLMRDLPLAVGQKLCFDIYGIRRIWRMDGVVEAREHISLPLGEFDAFHLSGQAIRIDNPNSRREVHIWISDDPRRLPLVAMGVIDLGAVRATLSAYRRPGEKSAKAQGSETLKW